MSEGFVRNKMFIPFSQECTFASGTGLGLSTIRQIVDSLGGKIDVRSQKGLGMEIKVWLCLPTVNSQSSKPCSSDEKDVISQVQGGTKGCRMYFLNPKMSDKEGIKEMPSPRQMPSVDQSIRNFLGRWFFIEVFSAPSMEDQCSDFFIYIEPPPIEHLLDRPGSHPSLREVPAIIICQNAFQANSLRANGTHLLTQRQIPKAWCVGSMPSALVDRLPLPSMGSLKRFLWSVGSFLMPCHVLRLVQL